MFGFKKRNMYDLEKILKKEIVNLKKKINKKDVPIAVQIPEGLKTKATFILDLLKEYKPMLFIDACYGACDLKDRQAKDLGCKHLIHFGHYSMGKNHIIKTSFVPLSYRLDTKDVDYIVKTISKKYFGKKVNLLTTAQYLINIKDVKKKLYKKVKILDSKKTNRLEKHMILGCDCSSVLDSTKDIVFIGDGLFHARNLFFVYNKDIFVINPITKETKTIKQDEKFIRQRYGLIALLKKANRFGVIVSTKKGQKRVDKAKEIYKDIVNSGKKAFLFSCEDFSNNNTLGIDVDCFINTACPRIAYDDYKNYSKPVITINEARIILDLEKEIKIDQIN